MDSQNGIFNFLLIFLGLRKKNHSVTTKSKFKNIVNRKVLQKKEHNEPRNPRNLTREIYKRTYNKDLSPVNSPVQTRETRLNINIHQKNKRFKITENILSWAYTGFIFLILCVRPSWCLYHIVNKSYDRVELFSNFFFLLIEPFQYVLSVMYFSTTHFEDFFLSKNGLDPKCFPTTNQISIIVATIFAILLTINFLFLSNTFNKELPNMLSNNDVLNFFIELFSWIYGRLVIYINLLCFSLVFCKHCKIIHNYVNKVQDKNNDVLTINIITQDILLIRNELEDSIGKFKSIFSSFTLLGAIGLALFFEKGEPIPWNQIVVYAIVQFIFLVIIYRVSSYQKKLTDHIRQPLFVQKFLKRYTVVDINQKFNDRKMVSFNLQEENSSMLDWIVIDRILNEKWAEFSVLGIDISNGELIKRGIAIVTIGVAVLSYFKL